MPAAFRVPLSAVSLGPVERNYLMAAIDAGWISGTGPYVAQFERRLAERLGRSHAIAVANGTMALEAALRALRIGPGDEVIVPTLTFAAPAATVLAVGATPVLVDVSAQSWTSTTDQIVGSVTRATRAIIAVDLLGHPIDYDELRLLGLPVIEDAAQGHGARYRGRPAGTLGDVSTFSFHANKVISTGEGGAVLTDSAELAEHLRLIVHHGMHPHRPYEHPVLGRNFRMTNLTAAIGLGQLDRWDELVAARKAVGARYTELLDGVPCLPQPVAEWADPTCWMYTVLVEDPAAVTRYLRGHGVDARTIWPPLHTQRVFGSTHLHHPTAEWVAARAIWLPTFVGITEDDLCYVTDRVREAVSSPLAASVMP